MLKTLRNFDKKASERILSDLTTSLLPDPRQQDQMPELAYDNSIYENVKEEIHQLLKIDPSDLSPVSRAKVFDYLAHQMSEITLAGADLDSIKKRVGERGDLRSDLYEIDFSMCVLPLEKLGIRQNHVRDTIRNADDVQEVVTDRFEGLSIYIKIHNKLSDSNRFALFVITQRLGYHLFVISAWRFYYSNIDVSKVRNILDFLHAFVDLYGVSIIVAGKTGKFFLYEAIEADSGTSIDQVIRPIDDFGGDFLHCVVKRSLIQRLYDFALIFAIDVRKYISELRRHGVPVDKRIPDRRIPTHLRKPMTLP